MTRSPAAKTWFVTGASSGFGSAFATEALSAGDQVVATARDPSTLGALVAVAPDRVLALALDVTRADEAPEAIAAAVARFGRIDVLVNNAGYGSVGAVEETTEAALRAQLETNFLGAVRVTRAALPQLRRQGSGAIVNVSSLGGQLSFAGFGAYSASKFALEGLSEALAQEVAPFGLKVLIVEPGAFRTGFATAGTLQHMPVLDAYRDVVGGTRQFAKAMHGTQPGDPAKAARAVRQALEAERTPLRLALGRDAVDAIRAHAEQVLADLAAWEAVGVSTAFGPAEARPVTG